MATVTVTGHIPLTLPGLLPNAIDVDEDKHAHILAWVGALPPGLSPPPWTFSHDIGEGAATEAMINLCVQAHTSYFGTGPFGHALTLGTRHVGRDT